MSEERILITGGSSGLGRAIAGWFAERGASVVSVDLFAANEPAPNLVHIECDLSSRQAVDRALPAILAAGPYRWVFLNAGASATGPFEALPPETIGKLIRLNAETPVLLASTLMREQAISGGICIVSSLSHFTGYPGAATYAASKDAVAVYAKSVRKPFARAGVSVTLACPGPLRTGHAARHAPEGADASRRMLPQQAAEAIIAATQKGRKLAIPGSGPKLFALAGRIAPKLVTQQMRKLILEKLDKPVW
ncbi:MAG: SDR family NAD(P)-dependent oxidoreductase [Rhizobiaceae bacterium]